MDLGDYKKIGISRTKSWIIKGLLRLLQEDSFAVITITEICQEADVVRATFYRNFSSKEDILKLYIKIQIEDYFEKLKRFEAIDLRILAQSYFSYWEGEKETIKILRNNNMTNMLLEEYNIVEKYLNKIAPTNKDIQELSEVEKFYFTSFQVAGLWRLVFLWAERNFEESVEEMTEISFKLI
jgi:AcrR family transcriptional regulator